MALEYETVKFTNDSNGIRGKNSVTRNMAARGWRISSESIEPGHIKGEEACCGAAICLPLGLLAGRTSGYILVTYARDSSQIREGAGLVGATFCCKCGAQMPPDADFCRKCGSRLR